MTKYVVLDTETSGLFDFKLAADVVGQPRMASIALIYLNESLEVEGEFHRLISPQGWEMDPDSEAVKINGLTNERLLADGVPVETVLAEYSAAITGGRVAVAFNAQYDLKILRGELRRANLPDLFTETKNICVMRGLTDVVKAPKATGKGWKFPKLSEAMTHFGFTSATDHDALSDARDCTLLFREMVKLGLVPEAAVHYAKERPAQENPRAVIGGNQPPADELTPFEKIKAEIEFLYQQARDYLDGEPISTKGMADDVGNLIALIRGVEKQADEARVAENKAFDEGKAAVQAKYAPLIADTKAVKGKTVLAIEACKSALKPWLTAEKERLDAETKKAREEADAATRLAQESIRVTPADNLAAREDAEQLVVEAKAATKIAAAVEKQTAKVGGSAGRSIHLTTAYSPILLNFTAALEHYVSTRPAEVKAFLEGMAEADVNAGKRTIPGFVISEEQKVA